MALIAAWTATPGAAACADQSMAGNLVPLGEAAEPQPTLTLALGEAAGNESVGGPGTLDVRLADVTVEGSSVTGFRVFVNAPDAGAATPIDDPTYVTSFSFFPAPEEGSAAGSFVVDIGPALTKLAAQGEDRLEAPLTVTLVPIGAEDARIGLGSSELME